MSPLYSSGFYLMSECVCVCVCEEREENVVVKVMAVVEGSAKGKRW